MLFQLFFQVGDLEFALGLPKVSLVKQRVPCPILQPTGARSILANFVWQILRADFRAPAHDERALECVAGFTIMNN